MAISSVIMKIKASQREKVLDKLKEFSEVSWQQDTPTGDMILLAEAKNIDALHKTCQQLEKIDGVLGVFPSYVTTADEQ